MTSNDLDMFKVKNKNMHVTYTPEAQIFVPFTLQWAVFELPLNIRKVHRMTPNDLDMFKVKNTNMHVTMLHTHPRPKLSSVSLYDEPFLRYGPIFGKVHQMTQSDLDMFKINNNNLHVIFTPKAQIFVRFTLWWVVFKLRANFRKSAPNDPKWPWHVQGQKYQHACYIRPRGPIFRPCFFYIRLIEARM